MPHLIGVAGPSGAGKTALAVHLARALDAPILSLDRYYRDLASLPLAERARCNFDAPDALESELLALQVAALAAGAGIDAPVYDFSLHLRTACVERIEAGEFVIVEGLFALYWQQVRAHLRTKVYVDLEDRVCFERRLRRDVMERGRTPESVAEQYERTVRPMAERYILPTREYADVVVSGTDCLEDSAAAVLRRVRAAER